MLEALFLASINLQYDKGLFIDLPVQYMKTTSSENVVYINYYFFVLFFDIQLSYCGLVDARKRASNKDLPVK